MTATPEQVAQWAREAGQRHHLEGLPRSANPFLIAALSNGAKKPQGRPSVRHWFDGWDAAKEAREAS